MSMRVVKSSLITKLAFPAVLVPWNLGLVVTILCAFPDHRWFTCGECPSLTCVNCVACLGLTWGIQNLCALPAEVQGKCTQLKSGYPGFSTNYCRGKITIKTCLDTYYLYSHLGR